MSKTTPEDTADAVSKALRRAWQLGQTYWQQADSEYTSHHKRADETQRKFDLLVEETRAGLIDEVRGVDAEPVAAGKLLESMFRDTTNVEREQPGYHIDTGWNDALRYVMDVLRANNAIIFHPAPSQPATPLNVEEAVELAKWRLLLDPNFLHANLVAGQPAKLTREHLLHLLGTDAEPAAPVELPVVAWKWEVLPGTVHSKRKGEPEGVYLQDPKSFGIPMDHPSYRWTELVKLSDAQAAIAAGRKAS